MAVTIRKLSHSCLHVDAGGCRVLVDPGAFTWTDARFDVTSLGAVDRVLVTHSHPDHLSVDFVRELAVRYPDATVESTPDVVGLLADAGVSATTASASYTARFDAPHEATPLGPGPPNVGFHIAGTVTHPGDSHSFAATADVLAIALVAPWGSMTDAVALAHSLEPRYVVPIHDWPLSAEGAAWLYGIGERAFAGTGTTFVPLGEFETVELDVG